MKAELSAGSGLSKPEATAAVVERLSSANRRPRGRGWETCGEHADFIRSHLEDGVRLTKARKLLHRQRQVRVSYMTLYRYAVEELGFGRRAVTIPVADCCGGTYNGRRQRSLLGASEQPRNIPSRDGPQGGMLLKKRGP